MAQVNAELATSGQEGEILTSKAVEFLCLLQSRFAPCRQELLAERGRRQRRYDLGKAPHSLPDIEHAGENGWAVKPSLADQALGQIMLACPPASELMARGVNADAVTLIADFDDCLSPTWPNCLESHASLQKALDRAATSAGFVSVRPRNLSLEEKHFSVGGAPISASLFDFGLSIFHLASTLAARPAVAHFSLEIGRASCRERV